jgi:hypothetical protein
MSTKRKTRLKVPLPPAKVLNIVRRAPRDKLSVQVMLRMTPRERDLMLADARAFGDKSVSEWWRRRANVNELLWREKMVSPDYPKQFWDKVRKIAEKKKLPGPREKLATKIERPKVHAKKKDKVRRVDTSRPRIKATTQTRAAVPFTKVQLRAFDSIPKPVAA